MPRATKPAPRAGNVGITVRFIDQFGRYWMQMQEYTPSGGYVQDIFDGLGRGPNFYQMASGVSDDGSKLFYACSAETTTTPYEVGYVDLDNGCKLNIVDTPTMTAIMELAHFPNGEFAVWSHQGTNLPFRYRHYSPTGAIMASGDAACPSPQMDIAGPVIFHTDNASVYFWTNFSNPDADPFGHVAGFWSFNTLNGHFDHHWDIPPGGWTSGGEAWSWKYELVLNGATIIPQRDGSRWVAYNRLPYVPGGYSPDFTRTPVQHLLRLDANLSKAGEMNWAGGIEPTASPGTGTGIQTNVHYAADLSKAWVWFEAVQSGANRGIWSFPIAQLEPIISNPTFTQWWNDQNQATGGMAVWHSVGGGGPGPIPKLPISLYGESDGVCLIDPTPLDILGKLQADSIDGVCTVDGRLDNPFNVRIDGHCTVFERVIGNVSGEIDFIG
jgi:hypothetical protein